MELVVAKLLFLGILALGLVFSVNNIIVGALDVAGLVFSTVNNNIVGAVNVAGLPPCNFPAIYIFGDSNSDTGNLQSLQKAFEGQDTNFLGRYNGRTCDGRLLIDFMAENLTLPYVSAYMNSMGTNFRHGANFATSSACISRDRSSSLSNLDIQIVRFDQFKARAIDLYNQAGNTNTNSSRIPKPEDFSKSLYVLDIGQNDFAWHYSSSTPFERSRITFIVNQLIAAVKNLYEQGGRAFWIHNTGPLGCYSYTLQPPSQGGLVKGPVPEAKDQNGCNAFMEEMSREYNSQLRESLNKLRVELPEAAFTYVDVHTPMLELITNQKKLGLGQISVDGIHRNEAANRWLANRLLHGSFSEPPLPISRACHKTVYPRA